MTKRPRIKSFEKIIINYEKKTIHENFVWTEKNEETIKTTQNDLYITLLAEEEDFDDWEFSVDTHFYHLYDQEWDSTNMTESWWLYDEAYWPKPQKTY